jgi:hypothetical protein
VDVGIVVGEGEGCVGLLLGEGVGAPVGCAVGAGDGIRVGTAVGDMVGHIGAPGFIALGHRHNGFSQFVHLICTSMRVYLRPGTFFRCHGPAIYCGNKADCPDRSIRRSSPSESRCASWPPSETT